MELIVQLYIANTSFCIAIVITIIEHTNRVTGSISIGPSCCSIYPFEVAAKSFAIYVYRLCGIEEYCGSNCSLVCKPIFLNTTFQVDIHFQMVIEKGWIENKCQ